MPRTSSSNEYERKLLAKISEHGWQCTSVAGEESSPSFSYTIGLFQSFGHPELVIFGLNPKTAHGVLSIAARAAAAGKPLDLQQPTDALLEDYPCVFVKVPESEYDSYILSACWYYEGCSFPLYQVVWPSMEGIFPWSASATDEFRATQPILGAYTRGS